MGVDYGKKGSRLQVEVLRLGQIGRDEVMGLKRHSFTLFLISLLSKDQTPA